MAGKKISCWKCGEKMSVIALVAPKTDHPEFGAEICILSSIKELPKDLLKFIRSRAPDFQMKFSNAVGDSYFANTCPKCKSLSGDFFLHSKPGGPFFPISEEEARTLYMVEVPISEPVEIEGAFHVGSSGELILKNALRIV